MLRRVKRALVESYIGAIALGYLLAEAILYFIGIFSAPVATWLADKRSAAIMNRPPISTTAFSLQATFPQLINFVVLIVIWYILLWWLYLEKPQTQTAMPKPASTQEQSA